MVVVSLATAPPDPSRLADLNRDTEASARAEGARERRARRGDIALSALLLLVIAAIWTIFAPTPRERRSEAAKERGNAPNAENHGLTLHGKMAG